MIDPATHRDDIPATETRLGGLRALGAACAALLLLALPPVEATVIEIEDPTAVERVADAGAPQLQMTMRLSARSQAMLVAQPARRAAIEGTSWFSAAPWLLALVAAMGLVPAVRKPVSVWQNWRSEQRRKAPPYAEPARAITPDMLEGAGPRVLPLAIVA